MKTKKRKKKSVKDPEVLDYCRACLCIRNGKYLSEENCFPHTCKKTGNEIDELIFHMNIINGMRGNGNFENEFI